MDQLQIDNDSSAAFLKSAIVHETMHSMDYLIGWIKDQNAQVKVNISKIRFGELKQWNFNPAEGTLRHASGKFFSIEGIRVKTNWGDVSEWDQPIINQPEVGYLGFIAKEFNDVLHFLLQAKIEPGNVNAVQLSPTLQATRSNYSRVHAGRAPAYLEYFQKAAPGDILLDQLQSEQGARFLRKRNRNIVIKVDGDIPVLPNFIWASLSQIKQLMQLDNLVNMDARTVISCIPYPREHVLAQLNVPQGIGLELLHSALSSRGTLHSFDAVIRFITRLKCNFDLEVEKIPLEKVNRWQIKAEKIHHEDDRYFSVIPVAVEIDNREVTRWTQPMIEPAQEGICAFICKRINGLLHFAVQGKLECGNFDVIELAPTVQCLTGGYKNTQAIANVPFLNYVLNTTPQQRLFDTLQSEEGGRFFKEQNRNLLVLADESFSTTLPDTFVWMTLNQLQAFIKFNNYVNIQARSLIAAISFLSGRR